MGDLSRKKKKGSFLPKFIFLLLIICGAVGAYVAIVLFEKDPPVINIDTLSSSIGKTGSLKFNVSDNGTGINNITVLVKQGEVEKTLYNITHPRDGYKKGSGPLSIDKTVDLNVQNLNLNDGEAEITITATDFSLVGFMAGNSSSLSNKIAIDTKPPRINLLHSERYIKQGGSGIVIYKLSETAVEHGAYLNGNFHPGFPLADQDENTFMAYIAVPFNAKKITGAKIVAKDNSGNESSRRFSTIYKRAKQKKDRINVSKNFLNNKIPDLEQYYPKIKGNLVEKFLNINKKLRTDNNAKIFELCQKSDTNKLWQGRNFIRMAGASKAGYADHRTYFHMGEPIDKQVHLGMDLASIKQADIEAAAAGKIIFTDYLGIYGNTVIIDHGQGLFSLYSHMSQFSVADGDTVERGDIIGLTGSTGMAGGDHLHFSVLINGIFVNPKEWWDQRWIDVTIDEPISRL